MRTRKRQTPAPPTPAPLNDVRERRALSARSRFARGLHSVEIRRADVWIVLARNRDLEATGGSVDAVPREVLEALVRVQSAGDGVGSISVLLRSEPSHGDVRLLLDRAL